MRWVCLAAAVCAFGCNPPPNNPAPPQKNGDPPPVAAPADQPAPDKPSPAESPRAALGEPASIGWLTVTVDSATVRTPTLVSGGQLATGDGKATVIGLTVKVTDPTKRFDYSPWGHRLIDGAKLADNFGAVCRGVTYGFGMTVAGESGAKAITSADRLRDVLVFEKPVPAATHLDLDLPAPELGRGAVLRFRIPVEKLDGADSAPAAPAAKKPDPEPEKPYVPPPPKPVGSAGGVTVEVESIRIGSALFGARAAPGKCLILRVKTTLDADEKGEWKCPPLAACKPELKGDREQVVKHLASVGGEPPAGQAAATTLRPGASVRDVLVFEKPSGTDGDLTLSVSVRGTTLTLPLAAAVWNKPE